MIQEDSRRNDAVLTIIAVEVMDSKHGSFVTSMARAWSVADPPNKNFIRVAWGNIIGRYNLRKEYEVAIEEHLPEYLEAED